MNKFNKTEILYISVTIIFLFFTLTSLYELAFSKNTLEENLSKWDKGIGIFINDLKAVHTIKDFDETFLNLSRFSTPPSISTELPGANLFLADIEYSFISNQLIKRSGNTIEPILEKLKTFNIILINEKLEKTETLTEACGFILLFVFENEDETIPVEITVFSEYLYRHKVFPDFFDFVDDREFY
ncbi:MAG: hypothetical protein WC337_01305 [Candidatus Muiribacteriota bacterium]|jgi:hypothetical protein